VYALLRVVSLVTMRLDGPIWLSRMQRLKDPTESLFSGRIISIQFYGRFEKLASALYIAGALRKLTGENKGVGGIGV
jgi:hypothetical protein